MEEGTAALPRWQLDSIYPGLGSARYVEDRRAFVAALERFEAFCDERGIGEGSPAAGTAARGQGPRDRAGGPSDPAGAAGSDGAHDQARTLAEALELYLRLVELQSVLMAYLSLRVAADSYDAEAQAEHSALRALEARTLAVSARFKAWLRRVDLEAAAAESELVAAHRYPLERLRQEAERMLGQEAEALAAALDSSGGSAWARLYNDVFSRERVRAAVLAGEEPREYGVPELRSLQAHPSEDVRRRAYRAELELLGRHRLVYAAAMNGIKGEVGTLARMRGWGGALEHSLFQHGITMASLEAMHAACEERFETARSYLRAKAGLLGKERLAWYDLFAPLPQAVAPRFTWEEAKALVVERFAAYSDGLAALARRAFDEGWVDVPPRPGKRGGAFCTSVPVRAESRVLVNFGGNLSDVFTLAHELGHAYHNACRFRFGRTVLQAVTPMTLAETASTFCETLLFDGLMAGADGPFRLALLEHDLQHGAQLLLDIHTRFLFEREVFERRRERELSPEEMCAVMEDAQARVFGDALADGERHPLMWAHKPHYYSSRRSFYNYPYTFGWLFSLGLYARYQAEGEGFRRRYDELLSSTGMASVADLARGFGIDVEDPQFWRESLAVVASRVEAFTALAAGSEGRA